MHTKDRQHLITTEEDGRRLLGYFATKAKGLDVYIEEAGHWRDHVHLLIRCGTTRTLADNPEGVSHTSPGQRPGNIGQIRLHSPEGVLHKPVISSLLNWADVAPIQGAKLFCKSPKPQALPGAGMFCPFRASKHELKQLGAYGADPCVRPSIGFLPSIFPA